MAGFDGGAITSDAWAPVLLGATDRAMRLVERFVACFIGRQRPQLVEHLVRTLVGHRVFGIALGYEDFNDHDELCHDPVMAMLAGKLEARREDCAPDIEAAAGADERARAKFFTAEANKLCRKMTSRRRPSTRQETDVQRSTSKEWSS